MALEQTTGDSLFGSLKKKAAAPAPEIIEKADPVPIQPDSDLPEERLSQPKYAQLDKVTVLLTSENKEGVDRVAKKLMKFRSKQLKGNADKERITSNMLIRALIDNFMEREQEIDLEILVTENDVKQWVRKVFKP